MLPKNDDLLLTGKVGAQIGNRFFRVLRKLGKRISDLLRGPESLEQDNVINRQGKERVGLAAKVGDAIFDRRIHDGVVIELVRDGFVVALEEILVDAVVLVEQLQGRFEAFCETVDRSGVETLVIDAADFEDDADLSALGEKNVRADEAVEIDPLAEGASLVVVFEDSAKPEHNRPFGRERD